MKDLGETYLHNTTVPRHYIAQCAPTSLRKGIRHEAVRRSLLQIPIVLIRGCAEVSMAYCLLKKD
jgi:hypothetical protein